MTPPSTLVRSKRKTVALIVQADGSLLVRAPLRLARKAIEEFIAQKSAWISSRQEIAHSAPPAPPPRQYHSGEVFTYLGKKYSLEIIPEVGSAGRPATQSTLIPAARSPRPTPAQPQLPFWLAAPLQPVAPLQPAVSVVRPPSGRRPPLELAGERFRLAHAAQARASEIFTAWYKQQARRLMEERVKWYASRFGLKYSAVRISSARTRWGSCSSRGSLSFTWRLVIAPLEVIDYVVAHELAHLRVKNHSPAFWREVESILPDYKARQKWLKTNGKYLEI